MVHYHLRTLLLTWTMIGSMLRVSSFTSSSSSQSFQSFIRPATFTSTSRSRSMINQWMRTSYHPSAAAAMKSKFGNHWIHSELRRSHYGNLPIIRLYAASGYYNDNHQDAVNDGDDVLMEQLTISGYKRPVVNWYPGHIAKAERMLAETLRSVDVVLEVRDARAPKATAHPRVGEWAAGKPRLVILTKGDLVPASSRRAWQASYDSLGAAKWDMEMDKNVQNQALQVIRERKKYDDGVGVVRGSASLQNKKMKNKSSASSSSDENGNDQFGRVDEVMYINGKSGEGIHGLHRAVLRAGAHINERRRRRGLMDRPLRVGVIGYPNVGKSAIINKILGGKKRARSQNTPGVTRSLQWIRVASSDSVRNKISKSFELLDSPGIIPANMEDQSDALLLAAVNSIGDAAYDNQAVAAYLMEWIKTLYLMKKEGNAPQWREKVKERYRFDPLLPLKDQPLLVKGYLNSGIDIDLDSDDNDEQENEEGNRLLTGEDMLFMVADNTCMGDPENASRKILQDFRSGRMGPISLQLAPTRESDEGQTAVPVTPDTMRAAVMNQWDTINGNNDQKKADELSEEAKQRSITAQQVAKAKGLELPPIMTEEKDSSNTSSIDEQNIGKGIFEGW